MFIGFILSLVLIPETFVKKERNEEYSLVSERESLLSEDGQASSEASYPEINNPLGKIRSALQWTRSNLHVLLIVSAFFVTQLGGQAVLVLLQYASRKFYWEYDKASFLVSVRSGMSLLVLAALVPALSRLFELRLKMNTFVKDKRITQISGMFLISGSLTTFLATVPAVIVLGQVCIGLGYAFLVSARSLATSMVKQEHLGALYTGIAAVTYSGMLIGGPLMAESFSWGMKLGDFWMGLPFLLSASFFSIALFVISIAGVSNMGPNDVDDARSPAS